MREWGVWRYTDVLLGHLKHLNNRIIFFFFSRIFVGTRKKTYLCKEMKQKPFLFN